MKIDRKIRVFISSKCGGQYTVARKALKAMLEETGFCEVYAFETDYGSSMPVVSAYLSEVGESDVIIVFVENEDGVTDPVQSEINRAKELKKKMLFIFCDEKQRAPTVLQEQLKGNLQEKYEVCHEFSDFPIKAYNSFFNDITRQYRVLAPIEEVVFEDKEIEIKKYGGESFAQIKKDNFNTIKSVRNLLKKMSGICFVEDAEYEGVDKEFGSLLLVLLGQRHISDVDVTALERHWSDIYSEELSPIMKCRKEAFIYYLSGKYKSALEILDDAVQKYGDTMPRWILNDIAIDMRNIDSYIAYRKGEWPYLNLKGQNILDEDVNSLFNPVIDRFSCDFYQNIVDIEINNKIDSPDTIHLGSQDHLFENLAKTFIAAVDCLSITHFLLVRKKIISLYSLLSFEFRNHSLFITAVKMLILERDEKNLKRYINRYGETTSHISAEDINLIQALVDNEQDFLKKIQAQSLLLEFFGYYYSDEEFERVINKYFDDINEAVRTETVCAFQYILHALPEIERRVPIGRVLEVLYLFLARDDKRWHNEVFSVLKRLGTVNVAKTLEKKKLIATLEKNLLIDEIRDVSPNILDAVQFVRLSLGEMASSFDELVEEVAPNYYEHHYSLNVFKHSEDETIEYLLELVKSIKQQNETQGKGGVYSNYAYNDFATIGNVISKAEFAMDYKKLKHIVQVVEDTIKTPTQTCEAKYYALRLLIVIKMTYPRRHDAKRIISSINNFNDIKGSDTISLQKRYSNQSLLAMYELSRMYILGDDNDEFSIAYSSCCEAEQIALLDSLCFLSKIGNNAEIEKLFSMIWAVLLIVESSESEKILFLLSVLYSNLYGTALEQKSLKRLISMLEDGTSGMKIGAMSRLKSRDAKGELIDYIYQQGRVDNNYCVREVANR